MTSASAMRGYGKNIRKINLIGQIRGGNSIKFLRAEMPAEIDTPFVLVKYADDGQEPALGLRLDLDKRVFMHHLSDQDKEWVVQNAAMEIVEYIGRELQRSRRTALYANKRSERNG